MGVSFVVLGWRLEKLEGVVVVAGTNQIYKRLTRRRHSSLILVRNKKTYVDVFAVTTVAVTIIKQKDNRQTHTKTNEL